jgi:SAM-dependent methyltransferase
VREKIDGARKLNLGSGWDIRPLGEGWVNLDGFVRDPRIVSHDFTRFPFPFKDDSFDAILASHVLEHVPVIYEEWNGTRRDILFRLFEELHRILRPEGRLHILVPLGGTEEALTHVGHCRQWFPKSFNYFGRPAGEEPAKYHGADFRLARVHLNRRTVVAPGLLRVGRTKLGVLEHLSVRLPPWMARWLRGRNELEAVLVARKGGQPG